MMASMLLFAALPVVVTSSLWDRNGWISQPSSGQNEELVVRPIFMLRHAPGSMADLEALVAEVSTPGRPGYGAYLDMVGLRERLPAAAGTHDAILSWLDQNGVERSKVSVSASGDMILTEVPAAKASSMFAAEFRQYAHPKTNMRIVRAAARYSVPDQIAEHVYLVGNLNEFPDVQRLIQVEMPEAAETNSAGFGQDCSSSCGGRVTPGVLAARYGFDASLSVDVSSSDTGMATAEFQGVYYDNASLAYFQSSCGLKSKVQVDHQIGDNAEWHCSLPVNACTEALLDIEYAKAVSGGITLTNIFNDDYSFLNWAKQVDDMGDAAPSVHSISYGADEVEQGEIAPSGMSGKAYMEAVNVQLAKLAARGISVLVASGDQGVCGRSGGGGRDRFHPQFPASSPYVTAVGGTDFVASGVIGEEQAWGATGGGFSDEFERPAWQQQAVESYFVAATKAGTLPQATRWNRSGRAYPDVAALGGDQNPFCIAGQILPHVEKLQGVSGTSASTPVFAAIVARLNAARLAKGLPRMGFLNPWIYQHQEVFNDVTKGSNGDNCRTAGSGFSAMAGWDPTTGMGTPNFGKMLQAALKAVEKDVVVV